MMYVVTAYVTNVYISDEVRSRVRGRFASPDHW